MSNKFYIRHFDDYHSIHSKTMNCIELGCFPTKDNYGYNRYFGLFYTGRRPSLTKIIKSLKRKVSFDRVIHHRTRLDIGITELELIQEIKQVLNEK